MNTIQLEHINVSYTLVKEKRKSLILSFKEGAIIVKAPEYVSQKEIDDFILKYSSKIESYLSSYEPYYSLEEKYVYIFNQKYKMKFYDISKNQCVLHGDTLYVYGKNSLKSLDYYLKGLLKDYCSQRIDDYLTSFPSLKKPNITIKKYKGRWGSCYYKEDRVSFNKYLIHLDPQLIDYVVVHELCHFLQANHSSLFYKEIEKRMPDYKLRIQRLKETHI